MVRLPLTAEIDAVKALSRELALGDIEPVPLKLAHHTTLRLMPLEIVARVQSAEPVETAWQTALKELAIARHLAERCAPALPPLPDHMTPYVMAGATITLWPYVEQARIADGDEEDDAIVATSALATLHRCLADYAGKLPLYTATMDRCWAVVANDNQLKALPAADKRLLTEQYRRLRNETDAALDNLVPLHGDIHLGNLLIARQGSIWLDFEEACLGPREYDVAGLPPSAWSCFNDLDQTLIERFSDLKSVCVAIWCLADMSRSVEVREAAEYHLARVREMAGMQKSHD